MVDCCRCVRNAAYRVNTMAVTAGWRYGQSQLEQRPPMQTFHIVRGSVRRPYVIRLEQGGIAVTPGAGRWQIHLIDRRGRLFGWHDVVSTVTIRTICRTRHACSSARAMYAGDILFDNILMTGRALSRR